MPADTSGRLSREAVERIYKLRPLQEGMLFHELLAPDRSPYFRQVSLAIEGAFDAALCEQTWNHLMRRHTLLRSVFDHERTAQPLQIVLKQQTVEFSVECVEGKDAKARIDRWRLADSRCGFDLSGDKLMRIRLFRLGAYRFEMVWSHPHILLDGWSGAILLEEFGRLYAAACNGPAAEDRLPPPPDPDPYFAALAARDAVVAGAYWAALLTGYDELATLPRLVAGAGPPRHAEHRFTIGEPETAALKSLAAGHDVTLGVLLQALWGLLLGRWTDRRDVVFGIVVSGRSVATPDIDRLVGMFINTLPVRVRWNGNETIGMLLRALQRQALDGLAHDHTALSEIQAASALPTGLLDHLLVLENYPAADAVAVKTGFTVTGTASFEQSNYDFGLIVHAAAALDIVIPYDSSRFPDAQMVRIERQIRALIAQILASPEAKLGDLDALPADELRTLAAWGSGPVVRWPETATLAELWHAQVDRTPDAVALVAGAERLSYRALDEAAEGAASRLRTEGLAGGEAVGVLAGRTAERVIALLGIFKAGGVYLPLTPALPDERLRFMLDDAGCRQVLADTICAARLAVVRPGIARLIAGPPETRRSVGPSRAHDVAYVIYTSGSTGRPKGAAVEHRGFVNMILAQIAGFGVRPDDAIVQFASCSFDASLSEIFMALLAGARLVMASAAAIRDPDAFLYLVAAEGVTIATLPPSYLRTLDGADLGSVRVLITAGEPPDPDDARHYASRLRYFNAYGPTEASVCASWHEVDPGAPLGERIPTGRPIANTRMMVRDRAGRPMPIGAIGEICLAGPGLARGYHGQAALTAERFPRIDGERWYRTGDAGLVQPDGTVLYLGRHDAQVKLNGYRIEPGEIETVLRRQPNVAQACVVVQERPKRLTAFVVPHGPVDPTAIRRSLAASLPPWMVPAAVLPLADLPRTVAGKIDRRALAATQPVSASSPVPQLPVAPGEALVAEAFAEVLGVAAADRSSSFAAAGGDSLRAIRLLGRLRRAGLAIGLKEMLAADTVAAIAAAGEPDRRDDLPPVTGPVPLTPIQRWFFAVHAGEVARFNHLVLLRASDGRLDERGLADALDALWRHHDALRLTFRPTAEGWIEECIAPSGRFALRVIDLRHLADPWPALGADADARQTGFDLVCGPLFQATLYHLGEGDHLLLNAHHLVVDALSWHILSDDLASGLRQAAAGGPIRLPGKTGAYRDWAAALQAWSAAGASAERRHWAAISAAEVADLPTDFARVPHGYHETEMVVADLGSVAAELPEPAILSRLLAALGSALHAWDGRGLARILLSNHGRHPVVPGIDVSRTVGWFTAEFPFLLDCRADADTVAADLGAVPSGGIGWGALRWLSEPTITLPEPEISLNYLGDLERPPDSELVVSERLPRISVGDVCRPRLIEIEASTSAGELSIGVRYAPRIHKPATARALTAAIAAQFAVGPRIVGAQRRTTELTRGSKT